MTRLDVAFALGVGIGLSAVYAINSNAVSTAAEQVGQGILATWNAMTFNNVAGFAFTCVGLSIATSIAFPALRNVYNNALGNQ
jgi:hypothetical protein